MRGKYPQIGNQLRINCARHGFGIFECAVQRRAEGQVHPAFVTHDPRHDAREILIVRLCIGSVLLRQEQLARLHPITGVQLVGHRHRHQREPLDQFGQITGLVPVGQREHLDQRRLGTIDAILGASFALGNPHRHAFLQAVANVPRGQRHGRVRSLRAFRPALDDEALVEPHQIRRVVHAEEIVADRNSGRRTAAIQQSPVHEPGVQGDIPMIGHEQETPARRKLVHTADTEPVGRVVDHPREEPGQKRLHAGNAGDPTQLSMKLPARQAHRQRGPESGCSRKDELRRRACDSGFRQQPAEHGGHLLVRVWTNLVEGCHWGVTIAKRRFALKRIVLYHRTSVPSQG